MSSFPKAPKHFEKIGNLHTIGDKSAQMPKGGSCDNKSPLKTRSQENLNALVEVPTFATKKVNILGNQKTALTKWREKRYHPGTHKKHIQEIHEEYCGDVRP